MCASVSEIRKKLQDDILKASSEMELENLRVKYLGKKGLITSLLKDMEKLSIEEKKSFGSKVHELKNYATSTIADRQEIIKNKELQKIINETKDFDISLPPNIKSGSYHPRTLVLRHCTEVFRSMGFTIEDYSEIVSDYECFESLNIPEFHPARDMQDTFYLENGELLKTHTSAGQNAVYKKYRDSLVREGKTIKAIFPGRCFRNESLDACHENTFFQMEGVMLGKNISIANLIYSMKVMLVEVFKDKNLKVRLRPGFFPFVEPGFELDCSCRICKGKGCPSCKWGGWLELCPCGMIHPHVLKEGGIDPEEYIGFAFGLGLDRLVMMKYGITDIRDLNGGNLNFLSEFNEDRG
ncbi:MAG: phenylalanine--tRNA ligase subunit alpha [Bdellovibrionota bacterium]